MKRKTGGRVTKPTGRIFVEYVSLAETGSQRDVLFYVEITGAKGGAR